MSTERTVVLPDAALTHVESWGDRGPRILCVHGLTSSRRAWTRLGERLAPDYRVYAYDQRGHGDSASVEGPMALATSTADLAAVAATLDGPVDLLIGHSWGGAVAIAGGRAIGARKVLAVDPMVAVAPGTFEADYVDDLRPYFALGHDGRVQAIHEMYAHGHPLDVAGKLHAMLPMSQRTLERLGRENGAEAGSWNIRELLVDYPVPLLVLAAGEDSVMSTTDVAFLRQAGNNVSVQTVAGHGHNLQRTAFEEFVAVIRAFVRHRRTIRRGTMARSSIAPGGRVTNVRWGIALILGLGVLINYIDRGALSVASKPLQHDFGVGPAEFGWLSAAFFGVYAIVQLPVGYVLDRYGVTLVSRIGALLWSLAAAATALAPGYAAIVGARLFLGLAEAPSFPADAKATGYWFPRGERSFATSLFDAAAKLSSAIGVPFTAFLLVTLSWRGMFWTTAALSLIFFVLFYVFYRNPSEDKRLPRAEYEYIKAGGAEPELVDGRRPRGANYAYLLRRRKVWGLTLGFAAYGYLFGFMITWLPGYLESTFHVNILTAGTYIFFAWGIGTISDLVVGGWLVDYLIKRGADPDRVRKTALVAGLILGLAIVGAAFTRNINVAIIWITIAIAGISFHAPVGWSIPGLIAPHNSTGQVGAIMNCLNNVSNFFAPAITGMIVQRTESFYSALITAGVILVAGIFSYTVILGPIEKIPEPT